MKKLTLTITLALALATNAMAQPNRGLFERGDYAESSGGRSGAAQPMLPTQHGLEDEQSAEGPIEGGLALLFGMAVMYLKCKKE